jgi:sialidase-1
MKRLGSVSVALLCATFATAGRAADATVEGGKVGNATFEEVQVVKVPKGTYGLRGEMGNIVQLKDGSLLCAYSINGIRGKISTDLGRTWGEELVLVPNPPPPSKTGSYLLPTLVRAPNGDLLISYIYVTVDVPGKPFYAHDYYRRSFDEGKTWGEQFVMTPFPACMAIHNDKIRVMSDGRIIAATHYKKRWPLVPENDHGGYVATAFYSDDSGYTWQMSENIVDMNPIEAQEPAVVELKDGRIMLTFRTYSGSAGRAFSSDRGKTWSAGEMVKEWNLPPGGTSPFNIDRIPKTGDLLMTRCTGLTERRRTPFVAAISKDDGKTWSADKVIAGDREDDYGYQSVLILGDLALIGYHKRDGLYLARVGIDWFYQ